MPVPPKRPSAAATGPRIPAPPFVLLAPGGLSSLVLTCEHASNRLPEWCMPNPAERRILRGHWGFDIGAWAATRALASALGATAIGGRRSRLWIDLNRRVGDPTLIRDDGGGVALSWNARLGPAERERRVLEHHAPYHEALDRLIIRRLVRGRRPLLLAIHTFTPQLDGASRAFDAGVLFEREQGLARILARGLRQAGLAVRYNAPYSGMAGMMYSVDRHGKHHGLPCLELEMNQALFDEPSRAARVVRAAAAAVRPLLDSAAGQGPAVSG